MNDTTPNARRRHAAAQLAAALVDKTGDPAFVAHVQARRAAIDELVLHGRRRRYAMAVQQKLDRALESYVRRTFTPWSPDDEKADRDKANAETKRLIAAAADGEGHVALVGMVKANAESRAVYDRMRKTAEKDMQAIAATLPIAAFVDTVPGLGLQGLASILAETGTLDGYANPAKVWSRLGFAPFDGFALSSWRRETWRPRTLSKDEWIAHPFSAERYAHMVMQAKPLRDKQWVGAKKTDDGKGRPDGPYGEIYAARRAHCEVTHPDWSDAHRDKDALRVMFKRLLADLWAAWIDLSFGTGLVNCDAHAEGAGSEAAAGLPDRDALRRIAGGGSPSKKFPGHNGRDAHAIRAGKAAAGHQKADAHHASAGGGQSKKSKRRGQETGDAPKISAASPPPAKIAMVPKALLPAAVPSKKRRGQTSRDVQSGAAASPPPAKPTVMPNLRLPAAVSSEPVS
jgi:hypothetical protein